jgi:hypothetical protein
MKKILAVGLALAMFVVPTKAATDSCEGSFFL